MTYVSTDFSISYILAGSGFLLLVPIVAYFTFRSKSIFLLDFVCYRPPDHLRVTYSNFIEHFENYEDAVRETIDFQAKVLQRSGIGDEACVPPPTHELPPSSSIKKSQEEVEEVLFTIVRDLFKKHKINPKSIDILVTNCSLFCPTPSISAMIINKFGLRSNVKSVSLSGMGCSAGLLSINLAKDLLKVHNNSLALVLSMEAISPNGYKGKIKSMLIANTIFRMGGAGILLSNKKQDRNTAKYKLLHVIRTHAGSDDEAYCSVIQQPDKDGYVGVSLSRALVHVARKALRINISELGPLVLPFSEQVRYAWSVVLRYISEKISQQKREVYIPNFKKAFEHFCIHAGGRAVIDAMEITLKLTKEDVEASRMTLYRFGNTSSSSLWYELCYLEAKGKVKKGDKIWQIAFGSGFKTNSAVWKCISDLIPEEENAWSDRIQFYPVDTVRN
ncbi:3-ketoacyl-CoA synthase 7 [Rutidosis leptorrhynchoides]|uniref:3-ketoacyl-CoA synthase 7 n=1 Tax=Rutidosis leptorrhynchoides TaxID=125765 RepID=UPI003A99F083